MSEGSHDKGFESESPTAPLEPPRTATASSQDNPSAPPFLTDTDESDLSTAEPSASAQIESHYQPPNHEPSIPHVEPYFHNEATNLSPLLRESHTFLSAPSKQEDDKYEPEVHIAHMHVDLTINLDTASLPSNEAFNGKSSVQVDAKSPPTDEKSRFADEETRHATETGTNNSSKAWQHTDDIMRRTASMWREVEPQDRTDAVAHMVTKSLTVDGTTLLGISRRGRGHAHDGKYREDHFAVGDTAGWIFAAVADGAGSQPLARVGAHLAVESAIETLQQELTNTQDAALAKHLQTALTLALMNAVNRLGYEAARRNRSVSEFSSTLLLMAYHNGSTSEWLGVAQVGDGGIALQAVDGSCASLTVSDRGRYANEAYFLTSQEVQFSWPKRVSVFEISQPFRSLIMATDGIFDDFNPPLGNLGTLFDELTPLASSHTPEQWLSKWSGYERRSSFDDRTLVVLLPMQKDRSPS